MTTKDIVSTLRQNKRQPRQHTMWMTLVWMLYKQGYTRQMIASALGVHPDTVSYSYNKFNDLLETKDSFAVDAQNVLGTHVVELHPYFVKENREQKIRTFVKIDNLKL